MEKNITYDSKNKFNYNHLVNPLFWNDFDNIKIMAIMKREKMKKRTADQIKFLGVMLMLSVVITFSIIFISAFLSPYKKTIVNINTYGEANLEFFILIFVIFLSIITAYLCYQDLENGK